MFTSSGISIKTDRLNSSSQMQAVSRDNKAVSGSAGLRKVSSVKPDTRSMGEYSNVRPALASRIEKRSCLESGVMPPLRAATNPEAFLVKNDARPLRYSKGFNPHIQPKSSQSIDLPDLPEESEMTDSSLCWVVSGASKRGTLKNYAIKLLKNRYVELFNNLGDIHHSKTKKAEYEDNQPSWNVILENPSRYFKHHQAIGELLSTYSKGQKSKEILSVTDGWQATQIPYAVYKGGYFSTFTKRDLERIHKGELWTHKSEYSAAVQVNRDHEEVRHDNTVLRNQLDSFNNRYAQLESTCTQLHSRNSALSSAKDDMEGEAVDLKRRLDDASDVYDVQSKKLKKAELDNAKLSINYNMIVAKYNALKKNLTKVSNLAMESQKILIDMRDTVNSERFDDGYKVLGLRGVLSPNTKGHINPVPAQVRHSCLFGNDYVTAKQSYEMNAKKQNISLIPAHNERHFSG